MLTVIRFALPLIAAGIALGPVAAEDKTPNSLTPKEVADGWLLLFDGGTTFGWAAEPKDGGAKPELSAKDGVLSFKGTAAGLRNTTRFRDFELTGEYRTAGQPGMFGVGFVTDGGKPGATITQALDPKGGGWRPFHAHVGPTKIALSIDNVPFFTGPGHPLVGTRCYEILFRLPETGAGTIELRNVKLRPLAATSLFNGKDLTGWKPFRGDPKRAKSEYEVTPAGELHVRNGPGDLQTEKSFADFVLQLECKTNGKNLNSGVFFRCVADQYQNGYEAQIHNGYKDGDRTKPVDFGTGAIYRRVPARKVVSNDNEWFTMTVVADGPHLATWVNGYQTVDWTDTRKPNDNPRNGLKTGPGHVSLQGHDPTTDLLFRNIRIAELKK